MDLTHSKGLPEPEAIHTLVVYDPETGKIVHTHAIVTYPGGKKHDKASLEARALEMARRVGREDPKKTLGLLAVARDAMEEGYEYSVDVKRGTLVKGRMYHLGTK